MATVGTDEHCVHVSHTVGTCLDNHGRRTDLNEVETAVVAATLVCYCSEVGLGNCCCWSHDCCSVGHGEHEQH